MLFLSDASTVIFLKFLQILLWISIPAFIIGMLITTLIHYRNKRKKKGKNDDGSLLIETSGKTFSGYDDFSLLPREIYLPNNKQEMTGVIHQLFHSKARYIAIRKDFDILSKKYQRLHINDHSNSETIKQKSMETMQTDIQQNLNVQMENITREYETETKQLHDELSQLNTAYENLEKENASLQEQLYAYSNDEKFTEVIHKWEKEKAELKRKLSEQEYLKDVLEEKKLQITFLQQQLEQRIKNHHLVEQQFRDLGIKFMEIKEELEIKQQSEIEFRATVQEKDREITSLKETLQSKTDQAAQYENSIKELQEQNDIFSSAVESNNRVIDELRGQLAISSEEKKELEGKLEKSNTLLKGFHRKLTDVLEEQMAASPVIVMKHVYTENAEQMTETAVQ